METGVQTPKEGIQALQRSLDAAGGLLGELLASLTDSRRSLGEPVDPRRFLRAFSAQIQRVIPHDRIVIDHLDADGRTFTVFAEHAGTGAAVHEEHYTFVVAPHARYVVAEWTIRSVFAGEAMLVKDFTTDPRFEVMNPFERRFVASGLHSGLFVPLESCGRAVGMLAFTRRVPDGFSEQHLTIARQMGALVGPLIENTILLERERGRRRRLVSLTELAPIFGATLHVLEDFNRLADAVRPHLDFDLFEIALPNATGREWDVARQAGGGQDAAPGSRISVEHLSFAAGLQAGKPALLRDMPSELDLGLPGDRALLEEGVRSGVLAPLWLSDAIAGGICFFKRVAHWYDEYDVEIATGIAAHFSVALQHQRLVEERARAATAEGRARELQQRLESLQGDPDGRFGFDRIIGRAPSLGEALAQAAKVAPTDTTVLLTGESGTGKELVARAVHHASARAAGPFVAINCAALPESLLEAELFGHERGAFTGADQQKPGRFELARGGTVFLDEIGELPLGVQAKLLRVLQEHEYQRVGGTATLHADVRVISATNRDLPRAIAESRFREDLYYRLNVFAIPLPALRERGDDVLLLTEHFLALLSVRLGKRTPRLTPEAREAICAHSWPGNIRELQNAVERALILSEDGTLVRAHFPLPTLLPNPADRDYGPPEPPPRISPMDGTSLPDLERTLIAETLRTTGGNKSRAARILGLSRSQLYTRLRRLGADDQ
jgi:transcriptional regulator with GAF, ATPase, and Fis domain